jgi:hypothetical protein
VLFRSVGHLPQEEDPEGLNRELLDWLSELSSGSLKYSNRTSA